MAQNVKYPTFYVDTSCVEERGSSLVETAVILPVMLLLVVGLVDVSRALNAYIQLSTVVGEATRAVGYLPDITTTGNAGEIDDPRVACPTTQDPELGCLLQASDFNTATSIGTKNRIAKLLYESGGQHFPAGSSWNATLAEIETSETESTRVVSLTVAVPVESIASKFLGIKALPDTVNVTVNAVGPYMMPEPTGG